MTSPRVTWDISLGTVLHLLGMAVLVIAGYVQFQARTAMLEKEFVEIKQASIRMERYLASKDPEYWKRVRPMDPDGGAE